VSVSVAAGGGGDVGGCCGACPVSRRRDRRAPRPPGRARGLSTSADGTERCATHASLSVRTTTGSRIADVARRTTYTALPAGIRSSASQSPAAAFTQPARPLTQYNIYYVLLISAVRVLHLASPVDPLDPVDPVIFDFFAGDSGRRVLRYTTGPRRPEGEGPFLRYCVTGNDVPRTVPTTR